MPTILLTADPFDDGSFQAPSFNGLGHNESTLEVGSAGSELLNIAPLAYGDDASAPAGADRPDPRTISNVIAHQDQESPSALGLTNLVWAMGQFLDHDLSLTPGLSRREALAQNETLDIAIPLDDPYMNPDGIEGLNIHFQRSEHIEGTGSEPDNPRQHANEITAWIDGSNIYGSSDERAALLRSFEGGRLKVSDGNLLPLDPGSNNDNPGPATELFIAGDVRANENIVLSSMHTLFVREHNRFAQALSQQHPDWTDEQVFQRARQLNVAQLQHIVFEEYLPAILGRPLEAYDGYDASIDAGISRTFSTAAFRFGHTMVSPEISRLDNAGQVIEQGNLNLADAFFPNTEVLKGTGIDAVLRGSVSTLSQNADSQVINELRNLLFNFGGRFAAQDLKALNIQRGRDHGLADYNTIREAFGLERVTTFAEINPDVEAQAKLESLYGTVDNIDAIVGMFAENPTGDAAFGETIAAVLVDQFTRLRDGDRFYYKNILSEAEIDAIESSSMADIIQRNTDARGLQSNVFSLKQVGTASDERLRGGLGNDTISAGAGNDKVLGFYGDDLLFGLTGHDTLKGDDGNDTLNGGSGNDKLLGRRGDDLLRGQSGNDFLSAGFGNDVLKGGKGLDILRGGSGDDYLVGGAHDDQLIGGAGHDRLVGTSRNRRGARERDALSGGRGHDQFILGDRDGIFYGASGNLDYARVTDFELRQDKLILHGSQEQYSANQVNGFTTLSFEGADQSELVAIVRGEFSLEEANIAYR